QLAELLIDRVVVTDGDVEIRYVIPTTPESEKVRFCHLRTDYFRRPESIWRDGMEISPHEVWGGDSPFVPAGGTFLPIAQAAT
ncbi:MAG: hypothetical protein ACR2FV_10440, partial [Ornithinimicrobium sp.]|uniref:hypothetical protein n=1 Tax=Ornithinimicrobium sp. TaxID=1977084 RepID=UPI003D9BA107